MTLNKSGPLNIVFDCERMKYAHTGLYHFCLQLGNALLRNTDPKDEQITFFTQKETERVFGPDAAYLDQKKLHKFLFPSVKGFDVWHSTYQGSHYVCSSDKVKKVITIHDLNFLYEHQKPGKIKRTLQRIQNLLNCSDKICTISEFVKKDIEANLQLQGKEIEVIYNGCNIQPIAQLIEPEMPPKEPFIFTLGTIHSKKNFHVLPALLRNNSLLLVIAGIVQDENYKAKILQEAAKFNASSRVFFTGAVSENDKQWYFKNCVAFAFPSIAEGFGLPVIEAMAFGKPVFLSTATSLPEIGGDAAFYFQSFYADDMQDRFVKGMEYYNSFNPAQAIVERAASFSWDNAAQKYLSIYRSLAE